MKLSLILALTTLASASAFAGVQERAVEYKEGSTVLEGFFARPDTKDLKPRPAVVIVHDWMGISDDTKARARQVAELGYVVLAADIYGKGTRPKDADEAAKFAEQYRGGDRALLRKRVQAAIDTLAKMKDADPKRVAIMGYCFGGTAALEAARMNAPVIGAISFHGGLSSALTKEKKNIAAKVLALHGADDTFVPPAEVAAFEAEMRAAKADWQLVSYGNAVHGFTHVNAPRKPGAPFGYDEKADKRSWEAMKDFFTEIFERK